MGSPGTFALALAALFVAAGSEAQPAAARLGAVQVAREGEAIVLTFQTSGVLPVPAVGEVDGPPRLFFDFAGVICEARGTRLKGDPDVRGVRAAQHTASPLVTRVVVDLVRPQVFRVDTDRLAEGILRLIGTEAAPPVPVATASAPSPAPPVDPGETEAAEATSGHPPDALPEADPGAIHAAASNGSGARPDAAPMPAGSRKTAASPKPAPGNARDGGDDYRSLAADPLGRLLALRSLLAVIDQFASPSPEELQLGADEFDRIRRVMATINPPAALRSTHDLLIRAASLGTVATRLRAEANRTSDISQVRNAGSAAAGARLLIEQACAVLGCPEQ